MISSGGEQGLVALLVFNTSGTGDPRPVGSIPATSATAPPEPPTDSTTLGEWTLWADTGAPLGQTTQTVDEYITT
jgi:hypothetical protein